MTEDKDDIARYRNGTMSGPERNALEKKALSDPFLTEALEGAESISEAEFSADVAELGEKIRAEKRSWFTPVRMAAGIVVLMVAGSFIFYFKTDSPPFLANNQRNLQGPADSVASISGKPDSTPQLLTMATEKPAGEETKTAAQPPSKDEAKGKEAPPVEIASHTIITEMPKAAEPLDTEKEKAKATVSELAEQKEERADDQLDLKPSVAAGAGQKKAATSERAKAARAFALAGKTVSGKVTIAEDGMPLPGAIVTIKGSTAGTMTDLKGNYSIDLPSDRVGLAYSFVGLETKEVIAGDKPTLDIQLQEDASQLSEVVVIGNSIKPGAQGNPVIRLASPVRGVGVYNQYLEKNVHYPQQALEKKIKGKVTITFRVTTTGSLTDFNVVKSLGYGCDEEVIRLVKEGPAWTPLLEDNVPVESEVRVKLKFDPDRAKN